MEFPQAAAHGSMDKSPELFGNGAAGIAGNGNPRKRASEDVAGGVPTARAPQRHKSGRPINIFSGQPPPVSFDQLQIYSHPPAVISTGLGLSLDDQNHNLRRSSPNPVISSSSFSPFSVLLSEEFAAQINQQKDEIEQVLRVQGEQLRRGLAEHRQRHYRALLSAAEESASRRLREKDAELERATRRSAELEDRLDRLRAESMAWQAKAAGYQATAASLHAQLQQAAAAAAAAAPSMQTRADDCGESPSAEDAASAYVDPNRTEPEPASCRACRRRAASMVLLPCRHLCLCDACDAWAVSGGGGLLTESCPICCSVVTGSVRVFFS